MLKIFSYITILRNIYPIPQMRKELIIFFLLLTGGLVYTDSLSGQQTQESDGSLLPDIDPQDIEIRSQYRARFPGLRRQPILGFTPGSRVFQVDPDRSPFLEDYEEIAAQLPVSEISRPEAPEYRAFPYATPRLGYGRFGVGNYLTPEAELYINKEVEENQWLSGSMRHTSGEDHLDQYSSFRYFDVESSYRGKVGERSVLGATIGLNSDFNYLPSLYNETSEFNPNPGRKSYSSFTAGTRVKRYQNTIEHLDIGLNTQFSSVNLDEENLGFSSDLTDWEVQLDGGYTWAGNRIYELFGLQADVQAGGYELTDEEVNENWSIAGASGMYQRLINYRTKLNISLGLYHVSDAQGSSIFYLAPDFRAEHNFSDRIALTANLTGKPGHSGHFDYHLENRFLLPENQLRHEYNLKAGAEFTLELLPNNKIRAGASFQNIKNYPYYIREDYEFGFPVNETVAGHYVLDHDNVTISRMYAGIDVDLIRDRLWFDVEGYIQRPRLSSEERVPFEEDYGLKGAVSIRPVDRILFEGWGNFTGGRITSNNEDLDPYLHLGTKLELRISERVGVYGKILNLLNQDYEIWQGFEERPFQIFGGITLIL